MSEKFGGGSPAEFLEGFGEFAGDADLSLGRNLHEGGERFFDAVRGLEKNRRFVALGGGGEFSGAASAFHRQKSPEEKAVAGKSRAHQRGEDGGGAWQHGDGQGAVDAGSDEAVAGIGNSRHPGIRDECDVEPLGDAVGEFAATRGFVVAVQADERFFYAEMLEEESAVAGILGGDEVGCAKRFDRTECDILTVADGGGNDAQHGTRPDLPTLGEAGGEVE